MAGTWKNKHLHISVFLDFCHMHAVTPSEPTTYDVLAFLVYLTTRLRALGFVFNYFSSVKTRFTSVTGIAGPFDSYHIKILMKGAKKSMSHQVSCAFPLSPKDLHKIINFIRVLGSEGLVFEVALLFGYLTWVCQSNLVSLASDKPDPHTLLVKHVTRLAASVLVFPYYKDPFLRPTCPFVLLACLALLSVLPSVCLDLVCCLP